MVQDSIDLVGKRLSLYQLFVDNDFIIEIPTIQRDYAQGRQNKSEVRDLFLQALYDYLEENKPGRDLDFVYGSTEIVDGTIKFIPLDGQQRLTTLFLLHWYLATASGNLNGFRELMLFNKKSRFTYTTRPSSSEFADALLLNGIDLDNLLVSKNSGVESLSETIMDKGWYFLSWQYDPTIQSMLTMLDSIHTKFKGHASFYERLTNLESPVITFQYLNLKEFNLTEDLYIKMNSRGKPLTSFENFKAKFEQHISQLFGEKDKVFRISSKEIKASYREYFSFQIDTVWANLFWQYKHLVGKPYTFDEELMNFIRVIIANQYADENPQNLSAFKDLVKNESATAELTENISFYKFKSLDALTEGCVNYLINAFDVLVNGDQKIIAHLPDTFYFDEEQYFEKALKYSLSLPERALFHAYMRYLIIHKTDRTGFFQWMRVMHNLVENSRIEDADQLINAIGSIEKLVLQSSNILEYLSGGGCRIDFFASWQVEEEIIKAHLILKSGSWQSMIEKYEKQSFHKGQLGYLFDFSGILEYYIKNRSVSWTDKEDKLFQNSFSTYASKSVSLFSIYDTPENEQYVLERALLSKGNYLIVASKNRYNFCSSKNVANYQRDYSWKRLLRLTSEDIEYWSKKRAVVKELLDDENLDLTNLTKGLSDICKSVPDDWRGYFVKNSELIERCDQGFIRVVDNYEVELLYASQLNHYHCDMYLYDLFTKKLRNSNSYAPFQITVQPVKNSEDDSFLLFQYWTYAKKVYELKIYRNERKYGIAFCKAKGNKSKDQYNIEVSTIIEKRGFKWSEDDQTYYTDIKNENKVVATLKELCLELNDL